MTNTQHRYEINTDEPSQDELNDKSLADTSLEFKLTFEAVEQDDSDRRFANIDYLVTVIMTRDLFCQTLVVGR